MHSRKKIQVKGDGKKTGRHIKRDEQKSVWWLQTSSNAMEALCFMFFDFSRERSITVMTAE